MSRLPLHVRVLAVFALLAAIVGASTLLIRSELDALDATVESAAARSVPFATALATAAENAKAAANDERGFLLTGDREYAEGVQERFALTRKALDDARKVAPNAELAGDAREILDGFGAWTAAVEEELALFASDPDRAQDLALGRNRDLRKAYEEILTEARAESDADLVASMEDAEADTHEIGRATLITLILLVAASAGLGVLLLLSIKRDLRPVLGILREVGDAEVDGLRAGLDALADGNLTVPASAPTPAVERFSKDELGAVARAVEDIRARAAEAVGSYERSRDALSALVGTVAGTAGSVASSSRQMAPTSTEAGRAVGEIAEAMTDVAAGAEQQVTGLEQARRLAGEVAEVTARSAGDAAATARAAEDTRRVAGEGAGAVRAATEAMAAVRQGSQDAGAAIRALGEKSGRIQSIVDTITGIAEQTNLLALNAAIEAARAGDQGRGFAVVADEVRKLAEESQDAAASIAALIGEILTETDRAVTVVADGTTRTAEGAATVEQARAAFDRIGSSVEDVTGRAAEIAAAIEAIAASARAMGDRMAEIGAVAERSSASAEQVSASTQQTSASTQEIAAGAAELSQTAQDLEALVARFTLAG